MNKPTWLGVVVVLLAFWPLVSCIAPALTSPASIKAAAPVLPPSSSATPVLVFEGGEAMRHAEAQMAFGPRPTGSEAWRQTGDYILAVLQSFGWRTEVQPFEYRGVACRNLIGRSGKPGGRVILLGAHYDTRRLADNDPLNPDQPVPGANDGASGVAVLLELARVVDIDAVGAEIWLVFFDAEDNGYLDGWEWIVGSNYFAQHMQIVPEAVIIVDMVGDVEQNIYYEANSDPDLQARLWSIADELGYDEYFIKKTKYSMLDDHTPFIQMSIPSVDIIDFNYYYWHTTGDTLDKISPDSLERVGRVLEVFLESGAAF